MKASGPKGAGFGQSLLARASGVGRYAVVPPYGFEGCSLPRLWCCAENVPDEDKRIILALEPRALPRRGH